jgi:hypothetical protein
VFLEVEEFTEETFGFIEPPAEVTEEELVEGVGEISVSIVRAALSGEKRSCEGSKLDPCWGSTDRLTPKDLLAAVRIVDKTTGVINCCNSSSFKSSTIKESKGLKMLPTSLSLEVGMEAATGFTTLANDCDESTKWWFVCLASSARTS